MRIYWLIVILVTGATGCQTVSRDSYWQELAASIRKNYKPSSEYHHLELVTSGQPLKLPKNCLVDIESGNGHGHYMRFMRFTVRGQKVSVEDAIYGPRWMKPSGAKLKRVMVSRRNVAPVLELVKILPTLHLVEHENRPPPKITKNSNGTESFTMSYSGPWSSSSDFFVLVRVMDEEGRVVYEHEFAGYAGGREQQQYLALKSVTEAADNWAKLQTGSTMVTGSAMRDSHCTDAFRRNRKIMREDFHWWVLEDSVEGLGFWGNKDALPVLKEIRASQTNLHNRILGKIDQLLAQPDYWLEGPPKDIEESR
jgi:hypothetical protein